MSKSILKPVAVALMLALVPLSISNVQAAPVKVGSYIGIWNAKTSYAAGDLITLNNKTFLSLVARNLNKNPDTNPTSWQLLGGVGATGLQGPIGLTGAAGSIGPKGDTGLQGLIGLTGPAGAKGDIGLTGSVGASGINGTNGVDGAIGPKGDTGLQGLIGLTGSVGASGINGTNGVDGAIGAKGETGAAGTNGVDGAIGPKGDTGLQGLIGLTGPAGAKGDIGLTGSVGASGINGTNGVDGTIGPKGDIGLTGTNGLDGTIGPKGDTGLTGTNGLDGTIGPKGDIGLTGPQGLKGDDGLQGIAGAVGAKGDTGLQGLIGLTGAKGDTGVAGSNGIDGAVGPKGDTGLQGPIGLTGADSTVVGPVGPRGPAGIPTSGTDVGDMQYWDGTTWVMIPAPNPLPIGTEMATLHFCSNGSPTWQATCHTSHVIYSIGDNGPAGGKVFYITNGGLNGLEASLTDQLLSITPTGGAPWGCVGTSIVGAQNAVIGSGASNTTAIINGCTETNIAASIANDYVFNGYSDWYLPSRDELYLLYQQKNIVGGFGNTLYWSSTEDSVGGGRSLSSAWEQDFYYGSQNSNDKNLTFIRVRAIRSF